MKSKKNEELNFLYLDEENEENTKKKKSKKQKQLNKKAQHIKKEDKKINLDNEIIIGVTKLQEDKPKRKAKSSKKINQSIAKKPSKKEKKKEADKKSALQNIQKNVKRKQVKYTKKSMIKELVKWTILLCGLATAFVFFMMSPLFNIIEITVKGNSFITTDTITSLSKIEIGQNIYKTSKRKIEENIKQNAYIEQVEIKRNLPNKIELNVTERKTTYMLEYANSFVYINNQGYMLEITDKSTDVPILEGYQTSQEELKEGNRLNREDLERLETILKIKYSAQSNGIVSKVNRINIQDKQNYILQIEEEHKTVYLGDASNLSTRMLYLKAALEDTKGLQGEIFVNGDLGKEKAFFRQSQ